jgi:hypothetical protein
MLLGIWLYGYMRRVRSTRGLEMACRERMPLLWLTGLQYPDHNTLWRFYDQHREPLRKLFKEVLQLAAKAGLVGLVLHAVDGTKLAARCSTDTADHLEALLREEKALLNEAVEQAVAETEASQQREHGAMRLPPSQTDAAKRRAEIKTAVAAMEAADTTHLHPQEPDARMQKVNGRYEMGYNAQAVVDENHIIVAEKVVTDQNDLHQLKAMLDRRNETLGASPDATAADGGYFSAHGLEEAQNAGHTVLLPAADIDAPTPDPTKPYDKSRFQYDRERDVFVCPRGELLPLRHLTRKKHGAPVDAVYTCANKTCPVLSECTKSPRGRTVSRSIHDAAIVKQREIQDAPALHNAFRWRKALVEVVFAVIKQIDGFRRFTVRGLEKVQTQWSLVCTGYNLRKLYASWRIETRLIGA